MQLRFTKLKRRNRNKKRPNLRIINLDAFLKAVPYIMFISHYNIEKLSIMAGMDFKFLMFEIEQRIKNPEYFCNEGGINS